MARKLNITRRDFLNGAAYKRPNDQTDGTYDLVVVDGAIDAAHRAVSEQIAV